MPSSDGLIVVEAAPREVVLLALGLLRTGRALGRGGCCAGGGDALALAAAENGPFPHTGTVLIQIEVACV